MTLNAHGGALRGLTPEHRRPHIPAHSHPCAPTSGPPWTEMEFAITEFSDFGLCLTAGLFRFGERNMALGDALVREQGHHFHLPPTSPW